MWRSLLSMFVCCFANSSVWCRMLSVIEEWKYLMSNWIKLQLLLSVVFLNHFKKVSVLRHCLNCSFSIIPEFIFSTSCLLTFVSWFLDGFIKQHVGLAQKLSFWSLSVTKAGVLATCLTLSLILRLVDMLFASRLIAASSLGGAFW